jgi:hypothetical protein
MENIIKEEYQKLHSFHEHDSDENKEINDIVNVRKSKSTNVVVVNPVDKIENSKK